ncbi:MAG: hypothetical protein LC775_13925 [Acidobacteria bacterium]|nr:hypothetical protein [Acidobacteriota bacterium]
MEFILTYEGPLASNGRPDQKNEIRRALHPQLKDVWNCSPALDRLRRTGRDSNLRRTINGHDFIAIAHSFFNFRAKLDILLLRPEQPGGIVVAGGDIDNRLKTLFDALACPRGVQDLPKQWTPGPDETPLHCLLEDDRYISRVNVRTSQLLNPPDSTHVKLR